MAGSVATDSRGNCPKRAPATTVLGQLMARCTRPLLLPHVSVPIEALFFILCLDHEAREIGQRQIEKRGRRERSPAPSCAGG